MDVHNELGRFAYRVAEVADQRVDQHADQVVDVVVLARFEEAGLVEESNSGPVNRRKRTHNVSNVRWSRARWVRECAEMVRARAAEALTRGGWASSSAQRWDTCRHRHEETNVSRARPHTPGARWDRARDPARDARGSVWTDEGAARICRVGRKQAQAAAAQRGQRTSLCQPLLVATDDDRCRL